MAVKNLYEAVKPILKFCNYVFGINLERETQQAEGCEKKMKAEGCEEKMKAEECEEKMKAEGCEEKMKAEGCEEKMKAEGCKKKMKAERCREKMNAEGWREKMKSEGWREKMNAEGWREKMCRLNFGSTTFFYLLSLACSFYTKRNCNKSTVSPSTLECKRMYGMLMLSIYLMGFMSMYTYYVIFDTSKMKMFLHHFKAFPVRKCSLNVVRKYYVLFTICLVLNLSLILNVFIYMFKINTDKTLALSICFFFLGNLIFLSSFFFMIFPLVVSALLCFVASYCTAHLRDVIKKMERAKSAMRKAKLAEMMLVEFTRLNELASMTNGLLSEVMSTMRMILVILLAQLINIIPNHKSESMYQSCVAYMVFITQYCVYFLNYLNVAPVANAMMWSMCKSLIDSHLAQEKWLSRDFILLGYLMKKRLGMFAQISHKLLNEEPFTISGSPVDGQDLLAMLIEINDVHMTLAAGTLNLNNSVIFLVVFCLNFVKQKLLR